MNEDDQMAAENYQQELEARRHEEDMLIRRCRALTAEQKVLDAEFEQGTKRFWEHIRTIK